jgi:hypothetical protein
MNQIGSLRRTLIRRPLLVGRSGRAYDQWMAESAAEETARLRREAERAYWEDHWQQLDALVRADLGYVPRRLTFRERMTDGRGLQLYGSRPQDILS